MKSPLLQLAGIPDEDDESPPLEKKSREELISLVIRLTNMTAQQARLISSLRQQIKASQPPNGRSELRQTESE